jgi:hypothetical protein
VTPLTELVTPLTDRLTRQVWYHTAADKKEFTKGTTPFPDA